RERKEAKESKTLKRVRNLRRKIEEKESYRWISSIELSKSRLPFSCKLTCICDREGDISELLERVPDADTYLLIRSRDNRLLAGGQKLYEYLDSLPVAGRYTIALRSDKRRQRIGRQARIEVKYARVDLSPKSLQGKTLPIYVVEAREEPSSVPAGQQAIHWRLLTTHVIENIEQAKQVIDFYKERWLIEQIFRLLKNKGLQIENSQL
ncbi:MAG: IS4 family transposase, partial [Raineya sp.]|nr:IS4 family transposase [Raineya sp.]